MDKKTKTIIGYVLVFLILIPLVVSIIVYHSFIIIFSPEGQERSDVLNFWGTYLGALLAVGGIYWQVRSEFKHNKEIQLKSTLPFFYIRHKEKAIWFGKRYFLTFATGDSLDSKKDDLGERVDEYIKEKRQGNSVPVPAGAVLSISNISPNKIYLVKINLKYTNNTSNTYYLFKMNEDEEVKILGLDITNNKIKLKEGTIYFTSTESKKYSYYFKLGKNLKRDDIQMIDDYSFEYDQSDSIVLGEKDS